MKKTLSIILSLLMIISVLSAMPFTALADDTCIVVGSEASVFGTTWDGSYAPNTMENSGNGRYTKTYTVDQAYSKVQCKVVKNGSEWIGDKKGWNVRFRLTGAGDFTVVYDTNLNYVTVTGDIVELIILEEGFTYNVMPDGWTSETNGSGSWMIEQNYYPNHQDSSVPAHSGDYLAYSAHTLNGNGNLTDFVSPTLDLSGMDSAKLNFWFINKAWSNDFDSVYLLFRIDGGDWNSVYAIESAHDNWTEVTVDLPTEALTSGVQIGFRMCDGYGYGVGIDDILLTATGALTKTEINEVVFTGISMPEVGQAPDYTGIETTTPGVKFEGAEWYIPGPGTPEVETFDYDENYALAILFSIDEDNYSLSTGVQAVCCGPENSGISYNCSYFGKDLLDDSLYVIDAYYTTPEELQFVSADDGFFDDFETDQGWTLKNGYCTNKWVWGEATNNGGSKALYVSHDGGTTNAYTTSASAVYAAKAFSFDGGKYDFSFDWIGNGETNYDYARAVLVPANVVLTAGSELYSGLDSANTPNGWIPIDGGSKLNLATEWQTQTSSEIEVPQGNYLVVFAWRNDASVINNPAIAIDNFRISGERKTITVNFDANGGTKGALWQDSIEIYADEFEVGSLLAPPAALITPPEGYFFSMLMVNGVRIAVGETPEITGNTVNVKFLWSPINGWEQADDGTWYYNIDGTTAKQWHFINGKWYYFNHRTGAMQTGWLLQGSTWYYLNSSGDMATGWKLVGGKWYYFDKTNGAMQTGWLLLGSTWYYLESSGAMHTGWLLDKGAWYYLDSNGAMVKGWQLLGGKWYYFNPNGDMRTAPISYKGKLYYFDKNGACTNP